MFGTITNTIQQELTYLSTILKELGFSVLQKQPHISGERKIFGSTKLVLICSDKDGNKVVAKCSRHKIGKKELRREKKIRDHIKKTPFTKDTLSMPKEIFFGTQKNYLIFITEYIEQEKIFVEYSTNKQFLMILRAFEEQESFHATTFEHSLFARLYTSVQKEGVYMKRLSKYLKNIKKYPYYKNFEKEIEQMLDFFYLNKTLINPYCLFLIHEDFVPHNFRIKDNHIYILDYSALHYGNKYESWARLINYMVIHNPELEQTLIDYIQHNRGNRDYSTLRMMRVFKIFQLLDFYSRIYSNTLGDLHTLTEVRINFWINVGIGVINDRRITKEQLAKYIETRNHLRSEEEKVRQREFAIAN